MHTGSNEDERYVGSFASALKNRDEIGGPPWRHNQIRFHWEHTAVPLPFLTPLILFPQSLVAIV